MKKLLLLTLACLGVAGCGTPNYHFQPYVGQQQNWATSPGSFVQNIDGVDIYAQLPSRPYEIIGAVQVGSLRRLAKAVKFHHADAAMISQQYYIPDGVAYYPGEIVPLGHQVIMANLIRFK
jgi:hypothetical protein